LKGTWYLNKMSQSQVQKEARQMTKNEVIVKALEGELTWLQAADILGVSVRQVRRMRRRFEQYGYDGIRDFRAGLARRRQIPLKLIQTVCGLKKELYADFSVQHFYDRVKEQHGWKWSYSYLLKLLQEAGLCHKTPSRGKYRRKRERRECFGIMLHLDASTHEWVSGVPKQDLVVMLDDATGSIVYAAFFPQEGTFSTLKAFEAVLMQYGRFLELYTDRGSHFCKTRDAGQRPHEMQGGQVPRVLKALGIRHILANSPQARGRSERAFGTLQGRLPKELTLEGITSYEQANVYLAQVFVPAFNRRFTVEPTKEGSAFIPLHGVDLRMLLSIQHERIVKGDHTVSFQGLSLQLPRPTERLHYLHCAVTVHEFLDHTLGVTYQGKEIATYDRNGNILAQHGTEQTRNKNQNKSGHY